jgi:hypothetical protein
MKAIATATLGLLLALTLSACSGVAAQTGPTPIGKVSTIEQVRDAFIAAGGVCNWKQDDRVDDATASGTCSDQTVIMLFANPDDKAMVANRLSEVLAGVGTHLLVGDNWIINSPEAVKMQKEIGGKVVEHAGS